MEVTVKDFLKGALELKRHFADAGAYLTLFSNFEQMVGDLISWIILPDQSEEEKRIDISLFLVNRLGVRSRVEILKNILKNKYKDIYTKHSKIFARNGKLNKVIEFRNSLVHSPVELSKDASKETLTFNTKLGVIKKGKRTSENVTKNDFRMQGLMCAESIIELHNIRSEIQQLLKSKNSK